MLILTYVHAYIHPFIMQSYCMHHMKWSKTGDRKGQGIEVSNSFTFDLIALNKAARNQNKEEALARLDDVKNDLIKFEKLDPEKYK